MHKTDVDWPPCRQWNYRPEIKDNGHLSWKRGSKVPQLRAEISLVEAYNIGSKLFTDIYIIRNEHATDEIPESILWKRYVSTDSNCHEYTFDIKFED